MYNEEQIRQLLTEKIDVFKKAVDKKKVPEYTEVYVESVDYLERICVHSEIGRFPDKLFKTRAPNQSHEEFEYMKANYKTTTFPIWTRFMGVLNRIWNDQNWTIKWPEGSDKSKEYIESKYPGYDRLEDYFKMTVTKLKEKDANGMLCVKPDDLPIIEDGQGGFKVNELEEVDPIAIIYSSAQVVGYDDDYVMIELHEKSKVKYGNSIEKTGKIFEFYDDANIWRITQIGNKLDYKFDCAIYWPHNLGYLPCRKLKGIPVQKEKSILYQSHFMAAVEPMDLVLLDSSYLQASKAGQAFPHKWEYFDECDYGNESGACVGGRILIDGNESNCPSCHGTGKKRQGTVLGVTQVKAPTRTDDSSKDINIPPMGWVAPDSEILEFLRKEIGFNTDQALSILNLYNSNSAVKGSDTALGNQIDREEMFSFIQSISNDLFSLFEFTIKAILEMRYDKEIKLPQISYPKTFSIRNENDLTEEITSAKQMGLPDIAIRKLLTDWFAVRFNSDEQDSRILNLAFQADRLVTLTSLEIASKKLSGAVANWEDILHTSVYNFITELYSKDSAFFEKDILAQKELLIAMAKAKDKEISPAKMNVDAILADANGGGAIDTPIDIEAEAKARLKGSVGGVQGIIQIQASVSQGITDYESAITLLYEIFGFEDATARKLLGNPVDLTRTKEVIK